MAVSTGPLTQASRTQAQACLREKTGVPGAFLPLEESAQLWLVFWKLEDPDSPSLSAGLRGQPFLQNTETPREQMWSQGHATHTCAGWVNAS